MYRNPPIIRAILPAILTAGLAAAAGAQGAKPDLTSYYRYPAALSARYGSLKPLGVYGSDFDLYELSAALRLPIPALPALQPSLQGGLAQFTPRDAASKWEHRDLFGLLGLGYSRRLTKTFELGGELAGGASLSLYDKLDPAAGTLGNPNLIGRAGIRLALVPSFNFSLEFEPALGYRRSLGAIADFDGFELGLGVALHLRLGEDPDAPKAALRSLRLGSAGPTSVFPAMQSWYAKNPFAKIQVTNAESFPIQDLELSFFQKGYMDSPTICARIPELGPGESREVGLLASFNSEVFLNEGTTPLSGEIVASYVGKGRPGEQRSTLSYDLMDKSAIVWDDDRKAAAFITPADSALRNFASYVRQINKGKVLPGYSETVQFASQLFHALGEIGILYQVDPTQPFASVKGASVSIDSVSLPRQTLKRITGDCDDLSVLYASLLESAGIQTALVTVPGHIYVAFGTKTAGKAFGDIHPDREMTIALGDELWVPVEITMIGKSTFVEAWRKGIEEWKACEADPALRGFYLTKAAQEIYRPVGLRETDLGLQYGRPEPVVENALRDATRLVDAICDNAERAAKASGRKEDYNLLGVRLARHGRLDKAAPAFTKAASLDPAYASPRVNLASVYFLAKDYAKALAEYQKLDKSLANGGSGPLVAAVKINLSKCHSAQGDYAKAGECLAQAAKVDPALAEKYAYLAREGEGGTRASEARDPATDIVFAE